MTRLSDTPALCRASLVGALITLAAVMSASAGSTCAKDGTISVQSNRYKILNNQYGSGSAGAGSWQCVNDTGSGSNWGMWSSWVWNSTNNNIKAYPSVYFGWHFGDWTSGSGLPVRLWDNHNVNTNVNYQLTGTNTANVAYDLFFHDIPNPRWETRNNAGQWYPRGELMVWLRYSNGAGGNLQPAGSYQGDRNVGGVNYEYWYGTVSGGGFSWPVWTFVRKNQTNNVSFNLKPLLHYIQYSVSSGQRLSNSRYLTTVQVGAEVVKSNGEGKIDIYDFNVNLSQ